MSDVVFVLGAGASKQCGAPLMADFLDVANYLSRTNAVEDKKEYFDRIFTAIGALQAVHSKAQLDLTNIESVFTALEIARVLRKLPGFSPEDIPTVISSLKEVIVKTLELTMEFPTKKSYIGVPPPYEAFAKLLRHIRTDAFPPQTVSVVTFNYDIAIDMALYKGGMGPDYGILPPDPRTPNPVPLFKLHGSLNWASEKNSGEVRPLHLRDYFSKYSILGIDGTSSIKIPVGSQLFGYFSKYTDVQVEKEPVIVPPTWNKADHHQLLSMLWGKAAQHLGEARTIFIIGYSLPETDAFFRLLYALGTVGPSPLDKIVVYNPDKTDVVDKRFREILGPGAAARYAYEPITFQQAIGVIEHLFPPRKR